MKSSCQPYDGRLTKDGYGRVCLGKGWVLAHRFAYALHYGVDPAGKVVMHMCDNPPCVNPEHLRLGTQTDNVRDMESKGRGKHLGVPGERNGMAKITTETVCLNQVYERGWYSGCRASS
jgi:hypothetical protein